MNLSLEQEFGRKNSEFPLVSVGIPVYNGMPYLKLALTSLIAQDYPNFEIIICDNCSTDSTFSVCQDFIKQSSKIKYYRNSENIGASGNFEKVFQLSTGKYFMWAAHDDRWEDSYISKCVQILEQYPSVIIACTEVAFISSEGHFIEDLNKSPYMRNLHTFGLDIVKSVHEIISKTGWYSIYGLIRSEAIQKLIPYLHSEDYGADVIWGLRLLLLGDYYRINEQLFLYRLHEQQDSGGQIKKTKNKGIKPYTSLFQNLFKCIWDGDFSDSIKEKIEADFIQTLTFENSYIFNNICSENIFPFQNYLGINQLDRFIQATVIDPIKSPPRAKIERQAIEKDLRLIQKQAIIAYPVKLRPDLMSNINQRCMTLIQALQSLEYEVTLFSHDDPILYRGIADNPELKLNFYPEPLNFDQTIAHYEDNPNDLQKSTAFREYFDQLCILLQPDLVIVGCTAWADIVPGSSHSFISILDAIDRFSIQDQVRSILRSQLNLCKYPLGCEPIPDQILSEDCFQDLNLKIDHLEFQYCDRYDYTLAIDLNHKELITAHTQNTKVLALPYIYDNLKKENKYVDFPIFIVNDDLHSIQGYLNFSIKILPLIRSQIPEFRLRVIGSGCKHINQFEGTIFEETVSNLEQVYAQAKFAVFPLIGTIDDQLTIIEAMAFGLPVIALEDAAKGSSIQHGINGLIAQNAQEFAEQVILLYQNQSLCTSLGSSAKQLIHLQQDTSVLRNTIQIIENSFYYVEPEIIQDRQFLVIIDGVFFQLHKTGIARVWCSLLEAWLVSGFSQNIIILDRENTAPKFPGVRYRLIPRFDYSQVDRDRDMLQQICDEEGADVFISTYYSTPNSTPSSIIVHDMIPEVLGEDLDQPTWREKHNGIQYASSYITVSNNTAKDLVRFFPDIPPDSVTVAHCGVSPDFSPAQSQELSQFRTKYGITRPYYLLVGVDSGTLNTHKNTDLFYAAFATLPFSHAFDVVCTGGGTFAPKLRNYTSGSAVHILALDDSEMRLAYSGAIALVYPSIYEGFGMPIIEAMACGCPVITCPNASIPEVAGDAAIFVQDQDLNAMADALCEVLKPDLRELMIVEGFAQARKFSWTKMADTIKSVLIDTSLISLNLRAFNWLICPDWSSDEAVLMEEISDILRAIALRPEADRTTLLISVQDFSEEEANLFVASIAMSLCLEEDLNLDMGSEVALFSSLNSLQWQALSQKLHGHIQLTHDNPRVISSLQLLDLPIFTPELLSCNDIKADELSKEF